MAKRTSDENLDTLVKYSQIDLVLKLVMIAGAGIVGYFGYIYGTEKMTEVQKQIEEYKSKLAKIPFVGKSFS